MWWHKDLCCIKYLIGKGRDARILHGNTIEGDCSKGVWLQGRQLCEAGWDLESLGLPALDWTWPWVAEVNQGSCLYGASAYIYQTIMLCSLNILKLYLSKINTNLKKKLPIVPSPSPWQPQAHTLASVNLTVVDTSLKWNHALLVLLELVYFT